MDTPLDPQPEPTLLEWVANLIGAGSYLADTSAEEILERVAQEIDRGLDAAEFYCAYPESEGIRIARRELEERFSESVTGLPEGIAMRPVNTTDPLAKKIRAALDDQRVILPRESLGYGVYTIDLDGAAVLAEEVAREHYAVLVSAAQALWRTALCNAPNPETPVSWGDPELIALFDAVKGLGADFDSRAS